MSDFLKEKIREYVNNTQGVSQENFADEFTRELEARPKREDVSDDFTYGETGQSFDCPQENLLLAAQKNAQEDISVPAGMQKKWKPSKKNNFHITQKTLIPLSLLLSLVFCAAIVLMSGGVMGKSASGGTESIPLAQSSYSEIESSAKSGSGNESEEADSASDSSSDEQSTDKSSNDTSASANSSNTTNSDSSNNSGKININTASEQELETIPGVGPATAKKIIEYRKTSGNFYSIDEIKNVKGIGDAKFNKMKEKITVG